MCVIPGRGCACGVVLSSFDGYVGCFHIFAIVNNVAVNIVVRVSFQILFSLDMYPGVELLDHMVVVVLVF